MSIDAGQEKRLKYENPIGSVCAWYGSRERPTFCAKLGCRGLLFSQDKAAFEVHRPYSNESNEKSGKLLRNILVVLLSIVFIGGLILIASYLDKSFKEEKPEASKEVEKEENVKFENFLYTFRITKGKLERLNLQEILKKNRKKIETKKGSLHGIKPEQLPVIFDSKIIRLDLTDGEYLICEGVTNSDYVNIQYYQIDGSTKEQHMFMYDDSSQELGHGPPPFMRRYGEKIEGYDSSDIDLSIFVFFFDVDPTLTDHTWINIRGIKTYRINGKTIFYLCKDILIIDLTNSRLKNIVEKYGKPVTQEAIMGDKLSNYADKKMLDRADEKAIIREVILEFFKEMDNLESPFKERVQRLEKDLNAVSLK